MCRGSIVLVIRSARSSIGCCSIISIGSSSNTKRGSRLTFSCKTRGFCPSCHAKRREEWGQWTRKTLLLDVPHRQVVLTIPKTLRIFFKYRRRLLGELRREAVKAISVYFEALAGEPLVPGIIVAVQTFGDRINFHPHLHLLVTEGGMDRAGIFHRIPRLDDARLAEIFAREVLALLVSKGLVSPEWAEASVSPFFPRMAEKIL